MGPARNDRDGSGGRFDLVKYRRAKILETTAAGFVRREHTIARMNRPLLILCPLLPADVRALMKIVFTNRAALAEIDAAEAGRSGLD